MASEGVPDTVASASPDAMHAHTDGGSTTNQIRITLPVSAWAIAVVCALSLAVSGIALYEALYVNNHSIGQVRMHEQLNAYNLRELSVNQITYLESHVRTNDALIQAYGIGKSCRRAK